MATGLVMGPDKQLIVLDTSYRHPFLVHLSQDGTQVEDFVYGPLRYAPPGSKFRFMGIYNKLLIVSDLGKLCRFFMPSLCIAHVGRYAVCPSVTFTRPTFFKLGPHIHPWKQMNPIYFGVKGHWGQICQNPF